MIRLLSARVALLLTAAVAVSSGLSAASADQTDDPYIKGGARVVDVSFAGALARAQRGEATAQSSLGIMYYIGQGVPQDYTAAFSWCRKAAEQGEASAQFNLGLMYDKGQGVAQDYVKALSWYLKAAEQGLSASQHRLGSMYYIGQGVPQDYAAAAKWSLQVAEQGDAGAQYNLGLMYHDGRGVPQDYVQAHKWYNLAGAGAATHDIREYAINNRDIVAAKMQPAQIPEAQRLASAWRRK